MSNVRQLSDDSLMQCASHAGRNLIALAILATIASAAVTAFAGVAVFSEPKVAFVALPFLFVTAGYWLLAIAARRGNPAAVTVVMVVLSVQIAISIAGFVIGFVRTNGNSGHGALLGGVIALLIVAVLARSRTVLLELRKRGLWSQRFGAAGPSGNFCIVGGTCFVVGSVGIYVSLFVAVFLAAQSAKIVAEEREHAQVFIRLIREDETPFLKALQVPGITNDPNAMDDVSAKVKTLEGKVESLQSTVPATSSLDRILKKYRKAVRFWKDGLAEIRKATADQSVVKENLESGDRLRQEALLEFDQKFGNR
jgi:hypothetical protein